MLKTCFKYKLCIYVDFFFFLNKSICIFFVYLINFTWSPFEKKIPDFATKFKPIINSLHHPLLIRRLSKPASSEQPRQ